MQIEYTDFKRQDDFPIEFLSSKNREENTIAQWFVIITISDFLIIVKFLFLNFWLNKTINFAIFFNTSIVSVPLKKNCNYF